MKLAADWEKHFRSYQLENADWLTDYSIPVKGRLLNDGLGTGKALALNTLIPTVSGWTTMGAIQVGNVLFDEHGQPCTVKAVHEVPNPPSVFDVQFSDGEIIRACGEHLWTVWTARARKNRHRGLSAEATTVDTNHMAARTTGFNGKEFAIEMNGVLHTPHLPPSLDPYVLGVWLGDGHSKEGRITLNRLDESIAREVEARGFPATIVKEKGNAVTWRFEGLVDQLRKLNLLNNKHVPAGYLRADWKYRKALLQGLMDTDGTCNENGYATFDNTNVLLADAVQELCASLGIKTARGLKFPKVAGKPDAICLPRHRVFFSSENPTFLCSKRKVENQKKAKTRATQNWRYIERIEPVDSKEPMRCIEVDSPSHLFLAGRTMVPTHNTRSAIASVIYRFKKNLIEENPLTPVFTTASSTHDWKREINAVLPGVKVVFCGERQKVTKRKSETREQFELRREEVATNAEWRQVIKKCNEPTFLIGDYWWLDPVVITAADEFGVMFDNAVLDEAHLLKKSKTMKASSVRSLVSMNRQTTLLTATVVQNRPFDLHHLLHMMNPNEFSSSVYTWARPFFHFHMKDRNYMTIGELKDKDTLNASIANYIQGREAGELFGKDMPARNFQLKRIEVPGAVRMSPAKMRAKKSEAIEELMREMVRYKIGAAVEIARDADKPAVMYTYRREDAKKLHAALTKEKISAALATGDLTNQARDKVIEAWKLGSAQVLVCTMDAVRESATLTRADLMVFVDLSWLPSVVLQCMGRIDPARQPENNRRPVNYIFLVTENGPDEVVAETLVEKMHEAAGIGAANSMRDKFAEFLSPLDSKAAAKAAFDPKATMELLVERLNARADLFADLGML